MKKSEIHAGSVYSDGKRGLREVVALCDQAPEVRYRPLGGRKAPPADKLKTMALANFAVWAKVKVEPCDVTERILEIEASRIAPRLTEGQCNCLLAVFRGAYEVGDIGGDRAAEACRSKGLIQGERQDGFALTPLGRAVVSVIGRMEAPDGPALEAGDLSDELFDLLLAGTSINGPAVIAALRDHLVNGLSQMDAWEKHGVNRSQFARRLELIRAEDARAARMSRFYPRDAR